MGGAPSIGLVRQPAGRDQPVAVYGVVEGGDAVEEVGGRLDELLW